MSQSTLQIVTLIAAATEKTDGGWFDSSVVVALLGGVSAIAVAYLGYLGVKVISKPDGPPKPDSGTSLERPEVELQRAAAARVEALKTYGPVRTERLYKSRIDLERIVAALDQKKQADARDLAHQLAQCTDSGTAAELLDQLITRGGSARPRGGGRRRVRRRARWGPR